MTTHTITLNGQPLVFEDDPWEDYDPYCLVCGRATDHTGEHDYEYALGFIVEDAGTVAWSPLAKRFFLTWGEVGRAAFDRGREAAYQAYLAEEG